MVENIDNLSTDASAEPTLKEMEDAINAYQKGQAEKANQPQEVIAPDEKQETENQPKDEGTEVVEPEAPSEATEQPKDDYDYKKGYEGLRSWQTKTAQEVAELKRSVRDALNLAQQPARQEKPEATVEQWQEAFDRDQLGTIKVLTERIADSKVKGLQDQVQVLGRALGSIVNKADADSFRADNTNYPGFSEMESEIKGVLQDFPPEIVNNPAYNKKLLDFGYKAVRGMRADKIATQAREQGRKEILAKKTAKAGAHVEGSGKVTPEEPINMEDASADDLFKYGLAKGIPNIET
jgi:hypothetical protein